MLVPLTADLTEQVLATVNASSDGRESWVKALNFAHAAMFSYAARDGSNPIGTVNIERLISALRLMRSREDHEAAPFVSSWREPVLPEGRVYADKWNSDRFVRNLSQALGLDGSDRGGSEPRTASRRSTTLDTSSPSLPMVRRGRSAEVTIVTRTVRCCAASACC